MQTGLVLAVPDLVEAVEAWRTAVLPGAHLEVPPHLSVLYPWVPREPTDEDQARVQEATRHLRPFVVSFREVGTFPGFVWLRPEPAEAVSAVYAAVAAAFVDFPPYAGQHPEVIPHLTVAASEPHETAALAARVAHALADPRSPRLGPFEVQGVDVALRHNEEEPFTARRVATFGGRPELMLGLA